jgi:hypothetical protein
MSDSPSNDKAQNAMRLKNSDNLQGKGANPTGCSSTKRVAVPQAKAEYARTHPHPYQKR